MPFERPTLDTLRARTAADVASGVGLGALFPRSLLQSLADALAGAAHGLHGHTAYVVRQILPDTADSEHLERWANLLGLSRKPAAFAVGTATFNGLNGTEVPLGTKLQRADGVRFTTTASALIPGTGDTFVSVALQADIAGADGNTAGAVSLTILTAIPGIEATAAVDAAGITAGVDQESDPDLLVRVQARLRTLPQGGAEADYVQWALEVPAVTRAWAIGQHLGEGTVGVTFAVDDEPTGPIPSGAKVAEVQAYIDDATRRPVTAAVTVFAPVAVPLNPTIAVVPDTQAVRDSVEASLVTLLQQESNAPGGTLPISHVREAISVAAGEQDHTLVSPVADIVLAAGELATLGTITWQ